MLLKVNQWLFTSLAMEGNYFFFKNSIYLLKFAIYIYLSHKLWCYTRISGPEKSRNITREKISYFFTCVDIANQLLTRHSPLARPGQVDE